MELSEFLIKAKKATYAGGSKETILEDGCKELVYEEGEYLYRDRYYGSDPFAGQEVVFRNGKVIWVMNYSGRTINVQNPEPIYAFLRKAMLLVSEDRPFRGPSNLKEDNMEYRDESEGDVSNFSGTERILFRGQEVYLLRYGGGVVE